MIAGLGVDCHAVDSGLACLAAVEAATRAGRPYDVVLLDVHMPGMDGFEVADRLGAGGAPRPRLVMVSSIDAGNVRAKGAAVGASDWIVKPVTRKRLLRALGGQEPSVRGVDAACPSPAVDLTALSSSRPSRVLLAEDNPINQVLAERIVSAWGHQVTVVEDGHAAATAVRAGTYDLVLMDLYMPGCDGGEATAAIRTWEAAVDRPPVPIIALTAHALAGERERCLARGMNDYVTKPIDRRSLFDAMERQLTAGTQPVTPAASRGGTAAYGGARAD